MAWERRAAIQREARASSKSRGKRPRFRSGMEIFWSDVLSWPISRLADEPSLSPFPTSFKSAADYYTRFKPLIMAEAQAVLAQSVSRRAQSGSRLKLVPTGQDDETLAWGARLLFFNFAAPLRGDQRECMRPGQVFVLHSQSSHSNGNYGILATWANGLARSLGNASLALMVAPGTAWPLAGRRTGKVVMEATSLESLLSLQRMLDACVRQPVPPFMPELLLARKSTHTRFNASDSSDDDSNESSTVLEGGSCGVESGGLESTDMQWYSSIEHRGGGETTLPSEDGATTSTLCRAADSAAQRLNAAQRTALTSFVPAPAASRPQSKIGLVQGPPGTGKTSFLVAVLLALAAERGQTGGKRSSSSLSGRVLVVAPSNKAVCLLLERFHSALKDSARVSSSNSPLSSGLSSFNGVVSDAARGEDEAPYAASRSPVSVSLLGVPENIRAACSSAASVNDTTSSGRNYSSGTGGSSNGNCNKKNGSPHVSTAEMLPQSICLELLCWTELASLAKAVRQLTGFENGSQLQGYRSESTGGASSSNNRACTRNRIIRGLKLLEHRCQQRLPRFYHAHGRRLWAEAWKTMKGFGLLEKTTLSKVLGAEPVTKFALSGLAQALERLASDPTETDAAAADALGSAHFVFATLGSASSAILRDSAASGAFYSEYYEDGDNVEDHSNNSESNSGHTRSTKGGATSWQQGGGFSVVVCDEAGQAVEAELLAPLGLGCQRLLLVGDPAQLPATTFSQAASAAGFSRSMLERLMGDLGRNSSNNGGSSSGGGGSSSSNINANSKSSFAPNSGLPYTLLATQYRMHATIASFPAQQFYDGRLTTAVGNGACAQWHRLIDNGALSSRGTTSEACPLLKGAAWRDSVFGGPLAWIDVRPESSSSSFTTVSATSSNKMAALNAATTKPYSAGSSAGSGASGYSSSTRDIQRHGLEEQDLYTRSIRNRTEAAVACAVVQKLVDGPDPALQAEDVVVIAMYSAQVKNTAQS